VKYGLHWLVLIIISQLLFLSTAVILILLLSANILFYGFLCILCSIFAFLDTNIYKLIKKASRFHLMEELVRNASNQLKIQPSYYENLSGEVDKYKKLRHDQLNYLNVLLSLLRENETAKAIDLLQQATGKTEALTLTGYCSNTLVDSILTSNKIIAHEQNIEYKADVILDDNIGIDAIDLCSVFSNILDNAVTACKAVKSERLIMLYAAVKSSCLIIRCKNTKANDIKTTYENKLLSSKGSKEHGLGLAIIGDIAQKYDGSLNIKYDDKYFQITVFLMCGVTDRIF